MDDETATRIVQSELQTEIMMSNLEIAFGLIFLSIFFAYVMYWLIIKLMGKDHSVKIGWWWLMLVLGLIVFFLTPATMLWKIINRYPYI